MAQTDAELEEKRRSLYEYLDTLKGKAWEPVRFPEDVAPDADPRDAALLPARACAGGGEGGGVMVWPAGLDTRPVRDASNTYVEPDDQYLQPPILTSYATRTMAGDIEDARRWYDAQAHQLKAVRLLRSIATLSPENEDGLYWHPEKGDYTALHAWLQREREMQRGVEVLHAGGTSDHDCRDSEECGPHREVRG